MSQISELMAVIGDINAANGWKSDRTLRERIDAGETYDTQSADEHNIAVIALIAGEAHEAIEEIRDGHGIRETYYSHIGEGPLDKPEGVPSEIADVIIRALDFANSWGIDIEAAIDEKLAYNATRGHRHGGKRL